MGLVRILAALCCAWLLLPGAHAAPPVTGNGFGFAVVSPESGAVTKFYAHPYSFMRPDPNKPLSEGIETTNFIKSMRWSTQSSQNLMVWYLSETHIIHAQSAAGEALYFMPFGLDYDVLVVGWIPAPAKGGQWTIVWNKPVISHRRLHGMPATLFRFKDTEEGLVVIAWGRSRALISIAPGNDPQHVVQDFRRWQAGLSVRALVDRELVEFERWRAAQAVRFLSEDERRLWRQSETILRMAQSRERAGRGLMVASLPDSLWFTPWVRDMAYAAVALAQMGHTAEARTALLAYFNARPTGVMKAETGGLDYQVSVARYFGDGAEEPFFTQEGATNIELDDWGLVLWLFGEYVRASGDVAVLQEPTYRGTLYESARDFVVKPLLATLEPYGRGLIVEADTSIWEERQKDKKHFAFTTAAAIAGLRAFADIAQREGDETARRDVVAKLDLLEKGFADAFVRDGTLRGTLEEGVKNDIDGALLAVIDLGVVTDLDILRSTVDRMSKLKVASGGYRRVRSIFTDPKIFEYWYERQEFVFVDLHLAEVYRRLGRHGDADAMLSQIVGKAAADHNFVPEMYVAEDCPLFHGAIGDPTSAIPMVGYGAGAFVSHVLQRQRLSPP